MKVLVFTFGTRGDVQPYVALATSLIAAGHSVDICTHKAYQAFVEEFGVGFVSYPGPHPQELFDFCVRVGIFSKRFFFEIASLGNSFMDSWATVVKENRGKYDLVISTFTTAYQSVMLPEADKIPFCILHYVPVGDTMQFYSPYAPWGLRKTASGPSNFNYFSHKIVDFFFGVLASFHTNLLRKELNLPAVNGFEKGSDFHAKNTCPKIYCYSPAYLPKPKDWSEQDRVVGYYWLPEKPYTPPTELVQFVDAGKPVYVGFGSVNVPGSDTLIPRLVEGLIQTGERILVMGKPLDEYKDRTDIMFVPYAVPHSWLFPRVKLCIHHGGAGTVAAALHAGVPSVIMPFFGDHFLWSHRLQEMGCGPAWMPLGSSQPADVAKVVKSVLADDEMIARVQELGKKVRAEKGQEETVKLLEHLQKTGSLPAADTSNVSDKSVAQFGGPLKWFLDLIIFCSALFKLIFLTNYSGEWLKNGVSSADTSLVGRISNTIADSYKKVMGFSKKTGSLKSE